MAVFRKRLRPIALLLIGMGIVIVILFPTQVGRATEIPRLALYSTIRMAAAYVLSLAFAIFYGTAAAANKRAESVLIPILDVLQSVPILGFFPAALFFFNGSAIGLEFAIVFLIFTSMAWNMAFSVYESLSTIPTDLGAAASSFGLHRWLRFRTLAFPAAIPKLVYNSVLSWTNGWFFLVASEAIASGTTTLSRPGLGSFIYVAGDRGDAPAIIIGIGALAAVVLLLDTFLWRPLSVWSERFRMDVTAGGPVSHAAGPYERLRWLPRFPNLRKGLAVRVAPLAQAWTRVVVPVDRYYAGHRKLLRNATRMGIAIVVIILAAVAAVGLAGLVGLLFQPPPSGSEEIPLAVLRSLSRLALAYGVALGWTIPVSAWVVKSPKAFGVVTPILEVAASIPATALLPAIVAFSIVVASGWGLQGEFAAFLVALFAMQWYLLFNLMAGVRGIPSDLEEAARAFGLRGWTYWRKVILPAIVPSLLTGSITAWGAGWNALIVAEYFSYSGKVYQVPGIGELIAGATYATVQQTGLLYLSIVALVLVVLAMNKLLWHPLIKRGAARYRYEV